MIRDETLAPTPSSEEAATMDQLLASIAGLEPDTYVVIPAGALARQMILAFKHTDTRQGRHRPERAAVWLMQALVQLGWTRSTRTPPPVGSSS